MRRAFFRIVTLLLLGGWGVLFLLLLLDPVEPSTVNVRESLRVGSHTLAAWKMGLLWLLLIVSVTVTILYLFAIRRFSEIEEVVHDCKTLRALDPESEALKIACGHCRKLSSGFGGFLAAQIGKLPECKEQ